MLEADLLKDICNGISDRRSRCQGKVNDTKRNVQPLGSLLCNELLAMVLAKKVPMRDIKIIATDLDEQVLEKAKEDRKSTRLNSSHLKLSRMPSSA